MPTEIFNQHRHPGKNVREDEPDVLPVEPAEGPMSAVIPDDPEQQRVILLDDDRLATQEHRVRQLPQPVRDDMPKGPITN